eukprot:4985045-Prymnesium_polylepis.1
MVQQTTMHSWARMLLRSREPPCHVLPRQQLDIPPCELKCSCRDLRTTEECRVANGPDTARRRAWRANGAAPFP